MTPQFNSRPPVELLQDIFQLKKRKAKGESLELPLLTVMIAGRQAVSGFLMDFKKDSSGTYHLNIELAGSGDVFFAEAYAIQGVVVHDIEKIDYLLVEITSENLSSGRQTTRLEIRKRLAEESQNLSAYFKTPIDLQWEEARSEVKDFYFIRNMITDLSRVMHDIGEQEPGKSAIAESLETLILQKGDNLLIRKEGKTLFLADTLNRSYSTNLQRANLYQAIVDVL